MVCILACAIRVHLFAYACVQHDHVLLNLFAVKIFPFFQWTVCVCVCRIHFHCSCVLQVHRIKIKYAYVTSLRIASGCVILLYFSTFFHAFRIGIWIWAHDEQYLLHILIGNEHARTSIWLWNWQTIEMSCSTRYKKNEILRFWDFCYSLIFRQFNFDEFLSIHLRNETGLTFDIFWVWIIMNGI